MHEGDELKSTDRLETQTWEGGAEEYLGRAWKCWRCVPICVCIAFPTTVFLYCVATKIELYVRTLLRSITQFSIRAHVRRSHAVIYVGTYVCKAAPITRWT